MWKSRIPNEIPTVDDTPMKMIIILEILNTLTDLYLPLRYYFPEFGINDYKLVINTFEKKRKLHHLPKNGFPIYETTFSINEQLFKWA